MSANILQSVKKDLGIGPEYYSFDEELIMHINTVLSVLTQIGYGPETGFKITGQETWDDYIDPADERLEMIKSYISKRVKLMFDPPLNSSVLESTKALTSELEWRINVAVDHYVSDAEQEADEKEADGDG